MSERLCCDVSVGLMCAFSFCECCLDIASHVHGEALVPIPGIKEPYVRRNEAVELCEYLKRVVTVDRRWFMPEHSLDKVVQVVFSVRAVDIEEPLPSIEKENHERIVGSSQGRDVTPAEIGDRLEDEPGDGVITVDADQVVQDSVAVHSTGCQGIPVHGPRLKGASAHLRF